MGTFGRVIPLSPIEREQAMARYYAAERDAGACALVANERMHEFGKRLDSAFERDIEIIRQVIGRK